MPSQTRTTNREAERARVPAHGNHREREILEEVRLAGGGARIQFLADRLGVSEETIRRNVRALETNGHVRKVHGGVYLAEPAEEEPLHRRMDENPDAKRRIAAEVARIIVDGDTLFLDTGSTTAYIARALRRRSNLFVVTNSIVVAHTLAARNGNRVLMAGGELRAHDGGAFGAEARDFACRFSVRYAVLSVGAMNAENGFMLHDMQEAEYSRAVMEHAQTCIVAADSSKFGRRAPIMVSEPETVDILVTEKEPPQTVQAMLKNNDVEVVIAGTDGSL